MMLCVVWGMSSGVCFVSFVERKWQDHDVVVKMFSDEGSSSRVIWAGLT